MRSKGVKEGPKRSKKDKNYFFGKIGPNKLLSGLWRSRPGRAEVEGVKTEPGRARGGPSMTKIGHLWPKNDQYVNKNFGHHPGDPCHSAILAMYWLYLAM